MFQKKGQIWSGDAIISFLIMFVMFGLLLFVWSGVQKQINESEDPLDTALRISDNLMVRGWPENWTSENVVAIGLMDDSNKFSEAKMGNLTQISISNASFIFGTFQKFWIYAKDRNNQPVLVNGQNFSYGTVPSPSSTENVVKIQRVGPYKDDLITLWIVVGD